MTATLRVGLIGANAERGWARAAHVPALHSLNGLELAAVANTSQHSADATAAAFEVPTAYGSAADLFADTSIEVVTVAAPVPAHHELILGAVRAGRHVYSEWPLGVSTAQTDEIAAAAARAGVHTAIGLQAAQNPAVLAAARAIGQGRIGRPLDASVLSTTMAFGPELPEEFFNLEDPAAGMHLLTIQTAHTMDVLTRLLGPVASLSAQLAVRYPELRVGDPARAEQRTLPDHVLLSARTATGTPLALETVGGRPADETPFRLRIEGERGTLELVGGAPRGFQAGTLALLVDGKPEPVDGGETASLPDSVVNVAATYAALRDDIIAGAHTVAGFEHAGRLTHLVDAIRESDATGCRITLRS